MRKSIVAIAIALTLALNANAALAGEREDVSKSVVSVVVGTGVVVAITTIAGPLGALVVGGIAATWYGVYKSSQKEAPRKDQ